MARFTPCHLSGQCIKHRAGPSLISGYCRGRRCQEGVSWRTSEAGCEERARAPCAAPPPVREMDSRQRTVIPSLPGRQRCNHQTRRAGGNGDSSRWAHRQQNPAGQEQSPAGQEQNPAGRDPAGREQNPTGREQSPVSTPRDLQPSPQENPTTAKPNGASL
uniref:Uncharacterized protein n=1 Tax=Anser brachyrhynchus TaxID=132585 RepID=A0A8B9CEX6_9AVES